MIQRLENIKGKFPTLERLALNRVREQFPRLKRNGFSLAVRKHIRTECAHWDEVPKSIGIIPDGWFEEKTGTFVCIEIEDSHPLSEEKLWNYCELYRMLEAMNVGDLRLLVFYRYGHNQRELDLCAVYLGGVVEMARLRRVREVESNQDDPAV
jgi:hypothetical protein